ncbi:MAG: hypothetical protein V4492_01330 [Chlamydiota bacterium]
MVRRTASSDRLSTILTQAAQPAGGKASKVDRKVARQVAAKGITRAVGPTAPMFASFVPAEELMLAATGAFEGLSAAATVAFKGLSAFARAIAKKFKKSVQDPITEKFKESIEAPLQVLGDEIANQRRLGSSEGRFAVDENFVVEDTPILKRAARAIGLGGDDGLTVDYDQEEIECKADIARTNNAHKEKARRQSKG